MTTTPHLTARMAQQPIFNPTHVLNAAADLIERYGWCQHAYFKFDQSGLLVGRCPLGAITEVMRDNTPPGFPRCVPSIIARNRLIDHLIAICERTKFNAHVADWNDHPERTQADVIAALRAAAATPPTPDQRQRDRYIIDTSHELIAEHLDWLETRAAEQEATQ